MSNTRILGIFLVLFIALVAYLSVFIVDERELAIKFRLGEIVRTDFGPGIHGMVPILNNVKKFEKRIITLDANPEMILTGEKKNVLVDYFVKWRIHDVEPFYRTFGGREMDASARLAQTIKDGLQTEFNNRTIREVVSGEREEIMKRVAERADEKMQPFGVMIVDVRIKQIELPPNVRDAVYDRMRVERDRIAKEHRAKGEKEARIIRAKADRERTVLLAEAKRKAEELRGAGDATATEIYAKAYGKNPEFYEFYRSLLAYRSTFNSKDDVLILEPDSEFFRYFGSIKGNQ